MKFTHQFSISPTRTYPVSVNLSSQLDTTVGTTVVTVGAAGEWLAAGGDWMTAGDGCGDGRGGRGVAGSLGRLDDSWGRLW